MEFQPKVQTVFLELLHQRVEVLLGFTLKTVVLVVLAVAVVVVTELLVVLVTLLVHRLHKAIMVVLVRLSQTVQQVVVVVREQWELMESLPKQAMVALEFPRR
jgi:hypothetical protein